MGRFAGRVAVITGGATGIGFATARALAAEGADVFIAGRDEVRGGRAVAAIGDAPGRVVFVRTDVADDEQVANLAAQAAARHGRIDVWFNNAGIEGDMGPLTAADDTVVRHLLETNVKGVFSGMRHAAAHMARGGVIVNNASFVGTRMPVPVAVAYGGTKAAVVSMTRAAAVGLEAQGIQVFAVCPYIVDTPMIDRLTGGAGRDARAAFAAQFAPSGRLTAPEDVARVVVGLCAGDSGHRSGDALLVDAGGTIAPLAAAA